MAEEISGSNETAEDTPAAEAGVADSLPANKVTIEDIGEAKKKVTIEIDRKRIDAKFDEIFGELRTSALVPGFRTGHAPRRLLEKRFGKEAGQDVRNSLVGESMGTAAEQHKLDVLGEPDIKLDDIELPDTGNLTFSVEVEVKPDFDLPDYKGIDVVEPSTEVTDERIENVTRNILARRGTLAPTADPAVANDLVVADVRVSGEGIDETHENMEFRVAAGAVDGIPLEELGEKLAGVKAGASVAIEATVPAGHQNEDWRDKKVTVTFDAKEVKRLEVPELTDALTAELGFDDVAQFTEHVKSRLAVQLAQEQQQTMRDQVGRYLLEKVDIDVPKGVAARQTARILQRRYVDLLYRGVPREEIDQNLELLEAQATDQATTDLKLAFILEKIATAEDVSVSEGEVNSRIAEMAGRQGRRPERLRSEMAGQGTLEQVEVQLLEQKTVDKLLEMANVAKAGDTAADSGKDQADGPDDPGEQPPEQGTETTGKE